MADSPRIEELRRRVDLDPASIAFAALAEEYRRAGQFEESITTCKAGLLKHPAYLSARVTLGRSLLELGRFEEAREELEHVLKVAPENLAAIRALAEIHGRRAEMPEAVPENVGESAAPALAKHEGETAPASPPRVPVPMRPLRVASISPGDSGLDASTTAEAARVPAPAVVPEPLVPQTEPPSAAKPAAPRSPFPVSAAAALTSDAPAVAPEPRRPGDEVTGAAPPAAIPLKPRSAARPANPSASALPDLEAFLARIVQMRQRLASKSPHR